VELQRYAEQVAREQVQKLIEQGKNASNASVVVLKNDTGEILAMLGSLDYNNDKIDGQVNVPSPSANLVPVSSRMSTLTARWKRA
jgi:membrane carboxypeptidase/penicillin-binding protein PbpC